MFTVNPLLKTDSYKVSHPLQYPHGTTEVMTYIESRGGPFPGTTFFGLQMFVEELANTTITKEMVEHADAFCTKHLGPGIFRFADWMIVVNEYGGKIPLEIRAVPEGTYLPNHNVQVTVRSTDPRLFWMTSFIETQILRAVWYPTTVATISNNIKKVILRYLLATSDDADINGQINFKLHDFGARGVSSGESAGIGGAAHLINFMGSDTMEGIQYANHFYDCDMAAFSIPAAEHSTITTYGRDHERDAFRAMLERFNTPLVAVVSDSYDLMNAVENIWGKELKQEVIDSGKIVVVRPDSGDPATIVTEVLKGLDKNFGSTINSKGYKVLNNVRVIQGDGINQSSIEAILERATAAGFAADNIAFGMGGALLQQLNRDTFKYADKACMAIVNGKVVHVYKDPATDPGKRSKSGDLDLVKYGHGWTTVDRLTFDNGSVPSELQLVYRNGETFNHQTLTEIRERVNYMLQRQISAETVS